MNRALLLSVLVVPSAAMLAGCFEDDDVPVAYDGDGGSEAAPQGDAAPDRGGRDGGSDSGAHPDSNSGQDGPDGAQPPPGSTSLATGMDLTLWGVTSDGYAIYVTAPTPGDAATSTTTIFAVPVSGGAATTIDTVSVDSLGIVAGPLVEIFVGANASAPGTLETWTSKGGLHTISSTAYVFTGGAASNNFGKAYSPDFSRVTYLANYNAAAQTADAYVANVDGTGATLLESGLTGVVAGVDFGAYPQLMFVGADVVLVSSMGTLATIESFAPPSWSGTTLASDANQPANLGDPAGAHVLYNGGAGLEAVAVSGGVPTTIDPAGIMTFSAFTSDGSSVVYTSTSQALVRSTIDSPAPTTLVSSNVGGVFTLSPDNSTALVFEPPPLMGTAFPNLYEASAATSGALVTLSASATAAVPGETVAMGSPFTNDDSHVLFYTAETYTNFFGSPAGLYVGTLESAAIGSGSPATLATNSYTVFASGKTKVVFDDGFSSTSSATATIDIKSVDTATSKSPTLVVSQANYGNNYGSFFLSPDGTQILFTTNTTSTGGLYVIPVP